jgi:hypothetical protein
MKKIFFITISLSMFFACKKEAIKPTETVATMGKITLKFDNRVGVEELLLHNLWYKNVKKDSFNVSDFQYTISDLIFIKSDGSEVKILSDSATYVISEADILNTWRTVKNIPLGEYKSVQFSLKKSANTPIFELAGNKNGEKYQYVLNAPMSVNLFFPENIEVKSKQERASSAHIFTDISLIMNGLEENKFAKIFSVNHVENY